MGSEVARGLSRAVQAERHRRLWAAVLLDGLRSAARERLRRWERGANVDARAWVASESVEIGSLRWLCEHLEADVETLRVFVDGRGHVPQRRSAPRSAA